MAVVQWIRVHQPGVLTPLLVRLRTIATWARPAGRERARADMRLLLDDEPSDALARRHVAFSCLRSEARFHPGPLTRQHVVGVEHLAAARARGHGVVVTFVHHGHYEGSFPSVAAAGQPVRVVVAAESVAAGEGAPGSELWRLHHARTITSHPDCSLVSVEIGFWGMLELLGEGGTIGLAVDFPGGTRPVRFLGREWCGMTSAASLARRSGAAVVPLTSHPTGRCGSYVELGAPLLPDDFTDAATFTDAILAAHEPAVRAWPEAYDVPTQMWAPFPR